MDHELIKYFLLTYLLAFNAQSCQNGNVELWGLPERQIALTSKLKNMG